MWRPTGTKEVNSDPCGHVCGGVFSICAWVSTALGELPDHWWWAGIRERGTCHILFRQLDAARVCVCFGGWFTATPRPPVAAHAVECPPPSPVPPSLPPALPLKLAGKCSRRIPRRQLSPALCAAANGGHPKRRRPYRRCHGYESRGGGGPPPSQHAVHPAQLLQRTSACSHLHTRSRRFT